MLLHSVAEIVIIMFVFDGLVPFFVFLLQTFFGNKICLPPSDWCIPLLGQDQKIFKKSKKVNQGHHSKRWVAPYLRPAPCHVWSPSRAQAVSTVLTLVKTSLIAGRLLLSPGSTLLEKSEKYISL
jgi:hypothetical protein